MNNKFYRICMIILGITIILNIINIIISFTFKALIALVFTLLLLAFINSRKE